MKKTFYLSLFTLLFLLSSGLQAKPKILTSVKPLALIAKDVVGDLAEVDTLLSVNADPHHYSMKISDRRKISDADLVVWMGPELERFLSKPLDGLPETKKLTLTNYLSTGFSDGNLDNRGINFDPHLWLSPTNASGFGRAIASALSKQYPELQTKLAEKLKILEERWLALEGQIAKELSDHQSKGFVADHNAYKIIANTYSLKEVGILYEHSDVAPSAKHLNELEANVKSQSPKCLLLERGHATSTALRWAQRWNLKVVRIDILGADPTINYYADLMNSVKESIVECMTGA